MPTSKALSSGRFKAHASSTICKMQEKPRSLLRPRGPAQGNSAGPGRSRQRQQLSPEHRVCPQAKPLLSPQMRITNKRDATHHLGSPRAVCIFTPQPAELHKGFPPGLNPFPLPATNFSQSQEVTSAFSNQRGAPAFNWVLSQAVHCWRSLGLAGLPGCHQHYASPGTGEVHLASSPRPHQDLR